LFGIIIDIFTLSQYEIPSTKLFGYHTDVKRKIKDRRIKISEEIEKRKKRKRKKTIININFKTK
jgi:hypothetical protein